MEITVETSGEATKLKVKGRLDAYWADHLAKALEAEIRRGSHHLLLDLSEVVFLSSAGIGTLVRFYKQLQEIQGFPAGFGGLRASQENSGNLETHGHALCHWECGARC